MWCVDGVVICPERRWWSSSTTLEHSVVDCGGDVVAPGLIDLQINGAFGVDFASPVVRREDVRRAARALLAHGCTAFAPTLVSSTRELYETLLPRYREMMLTWDAGGGSEEETPCARVLGLHLEGPFLSVAKRGAHLRENVRAPRAASPFESVLEHYGGNLRGVRLVTLAPELEGAVSAIAGLRARGVCVSLGHSRATLLQGVAGVRAGATLLTHLYNTMAPFPSLRRVHFNARSARLS